MTRRRRPQWNGWYVCEWRCGRKFRRGADYEYHVSTKHDGGMEPWPEQKKEDGMTLKEAAAIIGVSPDNLRQAIARGTFKAEKIGRDWHTTETEARRYLKENHRAMA